MARHNICAGDNYFTGSYYDLTQKPHLNTNNTTGLDYGDEVLNDTINLHKISKTGSFNDLKHVPQETLAFAESERQKSKNLFDYTKAYGYSACSSNNDGSFNINVENFYYAEIRYKLETKIGQSYSFSAYINSFTSSSSSQVNFSARFVYTDGTGGENSTTAMIGQRVSFVLTPAKEVDYILFRLLRTSEKVNMSGVVSDIQIEEGSVATDYQPYNGQITHNGDAPVVFAESERQKSKNLLKVNNVAGYSITKNGVTATINDDYTITLNGTCTNNTWWNLFGGIENGSNFLDTYPKLYLDSSKVYTGLIQHISGSASTSDLSILFYAFRQTNGTSAVYNFSGDFYSPNLNFDFVSINNANYLNNG